VVERSYVEVKQSLFLKFEFSCNPVSDKVLVTQAIASSIENKAYNRCDLFILWQPKPVV